MHVPSGDPLHARHAALCLRAGTAPRLLALPVTVPVLEAVEVELRVEATEGVEVGEAV